MNRSHVSRLSVLALRGAGGLLLITLWEIGARVSHSLLLPSFTATARALLSLARSAELWWALGVSNEALAVGFATTLAVGIPLGLSLGRWPRLDRWVDPYLMLLLTLPSAALLPLVFMIAGLGIAARATVVSLFSLPILTACTRDGVRQADPRLRKMATAFCATAAQEWRKVLLPAALPGMMTGIRLGLLRAVEGMVVVELLLVAVGLGRLLLDFQGGFESARVYAVVLVVMIEAVVLSKISAAFERRLVRARSAN